MKKLLIALCLIAPSAYAADCSKAKNTQDSLACLNSEVKQLKLELSKVLNSAITQTEAKSEFKASQAKWLAYKEQQCGEFVVADSQGSPAAIEYDLHCQSTLYKQRISLLKQFFN
jgi:uncharacterized protein YecT (DUF1311 family)